MSTASRLMTAGDRKGFATAPEAAVVELGRLEARSSRIRRSGLLLSSLISLHSENQMKIV